jgi:hypothetical protein
MSKLPIGGVSGRLAIVEAQDPAQAFPMDDRSGPVEVGGGETSWPSMP